MEPQTIDPRVMNYPKIVFLLRPTRMVEVSQYCPNL